MKDIKKISSLFFGALIFIILGFLMAIKIYIESTELFIAAVIIGAAFGIYLYCSLNFEQYKESITKKEYKKMMEMPKWPLALFLVFGILPIIRHMIKHGVMSEEILYFVGLICLFALFPLIIKTIVYEFRR